MSAAWKKANPPISFDLDLETKLELDDYARRQHSSRAAAIREFIEWGLENARSGESSTALHQPPGGR